MADILGMKLTYGAIEGSPRLRMLIAGLYEKQTPENVITAHGAIGANHLVIEALAGLGTRVVSDAAHLPAALFYSGGAGR